MRLAVAIVTHRGVVRGQNQDTAGAAGLLTSDPTGRPVTVDVELTGPVLCLVADGLGGHAEGRRASWVAARTLSAAAPRLLDPTAVRHAVTAANAAVFREAGYAAQWRGMGTTLAALVVTPDRTICVNVGDSRCYQVVDGTLVQLSVDDSAGLAGSHTITQALGGASAFAEVEPHLHELPTAPGRRYLLCTDGLTDALELDAVEAVLARRPSGHAAVAALLDATLAAGGPDNVSLVVVDILDSPGEPVTAPPAAGAEADA